MTHASLFSGIGGFDLAAEWAGWTNAFNCEIDPFCRKILKYHFPDAEQYGDIRTADFAVWRDRIDVLTGGFPCQPFSLAGKRKGTEDDRYLWPEMLRVIRTVRPRWVVGENVYGIVNWSEGMVLDTVCSDLEAAGYEVQPYIISACGVGAPHRRDRCWFVAHRTDAGVETMREGQDGFHAVGVAADADCDRRRVGAYQPEPVSGSCGTSDIGPFGQDGPVADTERFRGKEVHHKIQSEQPNGARVDGNGNEWNAADPDSPRFSAISVPCSADAQERSDENRRIAQHSGNDRRTLRTTPWKNFPTQSPVCSRNDGVPAELDGITFPKWRNRSIKAYGNAIVPQVALQIFETINKYENYERSGNKH